VIGMPENKPASPSVVALQAARRSDPDRFFCALFLPPPARDAAMTLIAFNHEITRAVTNPLSAATAGPMAGLIRLQWWREIVEGAAHRHELAPSLRRAIDAGLLPADALLSLLDAREMELEGMADWAAWRTVMRGGAGAIARALAHALGARDEDVLSAAEAAGACYGAGGLVRHLPMILASGRCPLPERALAEAGLSRDGIAAAEPTDIALFEAAIRQEGRAFLAQARSARVDRRYVGAMLGAVLGRRDLARPSAPGAVRGVGDRLAVMAARIAGRV